MHNHSNSRSRKHNPVIKGAVALAGPLTVATGIGVTALTASAESAFEEIVISASRIPQAQREVGTSISVLSKEDIEQRGFLALPDLLRTQVAISGSNNGGVGKVTSIRVRGEESFRTMVLIDGIDISDPSGPQVSPRLEHLQSAGLERIEILRGPQGLSYGADAGGVINITTSTPTEGFGGGLSAEYGRFGTSQLTGRIGGSNDQGDLVITAARFSTDGFNATTTDTDIRDDDGYENTTFHARGGWNINEQLRIEGVIRSVEGETDFDGCGFPAVNDCSSDFSQDNWRIAAIYETGRLLHELSYNDSDIERDSFTNGSFAFGAEGSIERFSYLGRFRVSDKHQFVYGLDEETETIGGSAGRDRSQTGIYAEYQGQLTELLRVSAGVRNDDNEDFGDFTSYRLSGAYLVPLRDGELKVKASYGTGFRAPSLFEINYNNGPFAFPPASDTDLQEETSAGYDLGVAWANSDGVLVELTWFDQDVEDAILFDLVTFSGYTQDSGTSQSRGVELSADVPLGEQFRVYGNYTWNDTDTPDGSQRVRRPQQLANLTLSYQGVGDRLRIDASVRNAADAIDIDGSDIEDYSVVDISVRYALSSSLEVYGRLENALDEDYEEVPTFNTQGQSAYAGIRYEF